MSDDDDIERLLREVDALTGDQPAAGQPTGKDVVRSPSKQPVAGQPAAVDRSGGSQQARIVLVSGVIGVALFLITLFVPFVPELWPAVGGFIGAWLALTLGRRFT